MKLNECHFDDYLNSTNENSLHKLNSSVYNNFPTKIEDLKIHASETAWVGAKFDAVLDNNGSIDDLFAQVKGLAPNRLGATEHPLYAGLAGSLHI